MTNTSGGSNLGPGAAKDILNSLISPSQNQKVLMSLEGGDSSTGGLTKAKLKRSDSGTSINTNAQTVLTGG